MRNILLTVFLFLSIIKIVAQAGSYDTTFDVDGKSKNCLQSGNDFGSSSAGLQTNGKIVCFGTRVNASSASLNKLSLIRYNTDGSIDTSFGTNGELDPSVYPTIANMLFAYDMVIQPDDKILVSGYFSGGTAFFLARFTANGFLDNTFNSIGYLEINIGNGSELAILSLQPDGKILMSGSTNVNGIGGFLLVRLNNNGSIDTSFSNQGITFIAGKPDPYGLNDIVIQSDGKIIAIGAQDFSTVIGNDDYDIVVFRFLSNGILDTSFANNGKLVIPFPPCASEQAEKVSIQPDGKILILAGLPYPCSSYGAVLIRLNSDGSPDNSFGTNGLFYLSRTSISDATYLDMALQIDGKILVCDSYFFRVVRINSNGTVDSTFANNGLLSNVFVTQSSASKILIQPDNKIVVCGSSKYPNNGAPYCSAIIRLNPGILATEEFESSSFVVYPNPITNEVFFDNNITQFDSVVVYNYLGQEVLIKKLDFSNQETINLTNFVTGMYLLKLSNNNKTVFKSIIKK
jgi:uncharacterized delta-60 repeat protein